MRIFLPLLCALCATPVHGIFEGTCPRKDPPPGVLVLSTGSKLVLTCSGHVEVDGVKVSIARKSSNTIRRRSSSDATPTTVNIIGVLMKSDQHTTENSVSDSNPAEAGKNRSIGHAGTGSTASPSTRSVRPTGESRLFKAESTWEAEEMDGESDYEEEEKEEEEKGSRGTRGIKLRLQWKWNVTTVGKGDRNLGDNTFERGASLSLSSVRLTDSGRYTCYHRDQERFSIKVNVADPPESPSLSCYKRSPSSKIRCEWTSQKPITMLPNCYLLLSKSTKGPFLHVNCSYSSKRSRCWCALAHHEDELRSLHMAYLCVTSIAGNATSALLPFLPLDILKPDPPSHVTVTQEEGQKMRLKVTWNSPISWKSQDSFYHLIYQINYGPLKCSNCGQTQMIKDQRSYTITDAMPGVEYRIQLRTKDEYDGRWSDWSTPVNASSWLATTAKGSDEMLNYDLSVTTDGGSGADGDYESDDAERVQKVVDVSHHVLWICGLFALLSVILAAYIFRHKDRFMSKLQSLSVVTRCGDSPWPPPSAPTPPEGQALVTFAPPRYKAPPPSEVEEGDEENEEEEQQLKERTEAMHFNNTSYFSLNREG